MSNNRPWPNELIEKLERLWVVEKRSADYCAKELGFENRNPVCGQVARMRKRLIADGKHEEAALWARGSNGSHAPMAKQKSQTEPSINKPHAVRKARAITPKPAPRPARSSAQ